MTGLSSTRVGWTSTLQATGTTTNRCGRLPKARTVRLLTIPAFNRLTLAGCLPELLVSYVRLVC